MKGDEYDVFILDPSDFWWRNYLPRVWGVAAPFAKVMPLTEISEMSISWFGDPEVQEALKKMMEAGEVALAWQKKIIAGNRHLTELGFPDMQGLGGGQGHRPGSAAVE